MFEGFSFPSPCTGQDSSSSIASPTANHSNSDSIMVESDSSMVSPLSSRCPSPVSFPRSSRDNHLFPKRSRSHFRRAPAPTSMPSGYSDGHRLSVGTLTQKLHAHSLDQDISSDSDDGRGFPPTPPHRPHAEAPAIWLENEPLTPFDKHPSSGSSRLDFYSSSKHQPSPYQRSFSTNNALSPRSRSASPQDDCVIPPPHDIREQRETLSLLQSTARTASETVRLGFLMEENGCLSLNDQNEDCHPSSLPSSPPSSSRKRALLNQSSYRKNSYSGYYKPSETSSRQKSSSPNPSMKVAKNQFSNSNTDRGLRRGKSSQALRRRSLVLAAITSWVDTEGVEKQNMDRGFDQLGVHANAYGHGISGLRRSSAVPLSTQIPRSDPR